MFDILFSLLASVAKPVPPATCASYLAPDEEVRLMSRLEHAQVKTWQIEIFKDQIWTALPLQEFWGPLNEVERKTLTTRYVTDLTAAIGQKTMGNDRVAERIVEGLVDLLQREHEVVVDPDEMMRELSAFAKRWEIENTMAQYVLTGTPQPEAALLGMYRLQFDPATSAVEFDPRPTELIKVALQYGEMTGSFPVLQIAHDQTLTRDALGFYFPEDLTTADVQPLLARRPGDIEPSRYAKYLQSLGPYRLILAQDVFGTAMLGRPAEPRQATRTLRSLLAPGGVIVLVQRADDPPAFSRADAEAAGLRVVRWADPRPLPHAWRKSAPDSSLLTAYVLRHPAAHPAGPDTNMRHIPFGRPE